MAQDAASAQPAYLQGNSTSFLAAPLFEESGLQGSFTAGGPANGPAVPSSTGPVGEPGLPPARLSAAYTSNQSRAGTSSGPASRRGVSGLSAGGRSSYHTDPSPPSTATSRTHVPNIISSAFLRPISSKRAQQHEQPSLPLSQQLPIARPSMDSSRRSHRHRGSNASLVTLEGQQRPLVDPDAPPMPTSRGTGTTARETQPSVGRVSSMESGGSLMPLQKPRTPAPLQLGAQTRSSSLNAQKSPRSNRSLHASWGRTSRSGRPNEQHGSHEGHTKLASAPPSPAYAPEKSSTTKKSADLGRNYEYYNGNAVFFLKGRLINSRQKPLNILTGLLTVLPAVLFFVFSAPWLWHHVSPAIPIIFAYVFFICISSFLHASFTEPGVIPRNLHPHPPAPPNEDPLATGPPTTEWVTVRSYASAADGNATAMEVPIKYCKSCNIWRPPRAHHCRVCDSCIETQDHHCVWLNNCVGRRNYRYFLTFVATGTIMGLFLLAASLAHILVWMVRNDSNFGHAINVWRVPFAMFVYSLIILPYPASLWAYHLFLMGRGETTREYLNSHKFQKRDRHRPFSQHSILKNWASIVMRPRPPTYMQFKSSYKRGDRRIGGTAKVDNADKMQEKDGGLEMKQMNGSSRGSSRGFQGPRGRGPINNVNNTPRGDGTGAASPKL